MKIKERKPRIRYVYIVIRHDRPEQFMWPSSKVMSVFLSTRKANKFIALLQIAEHANGQINYFDYETIKREVL